MKSNKSRWHGVFTLFAIVIIAYIDRINISILIADRDFLSHMGIVASDRAAQGLLATAFMIGYGSAAFFLTPFCEALFGVRRSLIYGLLLWGSVTLATPFFDSYGALLLSRVFLGLSEGPLFALASSYIKSYYDAQENGKPNAILNTGTGIGLALGYPLISALVVGIHWQASFVVLGLVNILIGIPLVLAFISMPVAPDGAPAKPTFTQACAKVPTMIHGALQTRNILLMAAIATMTLAYLWGSGSWLPSYLKEARGFSFSEMGPLASLPQWASVVSILLSGVLLDRIERRNVPMLFSASALLVALSIYLAINAEDRLVAVGFLTAANFFWGLSYPGVLALIQYFSKPEYTASSCGVALGCAGLVSGLMPLLMGWAIALASEGGDAKAGFFVGFALLIGTQVVIVACSAVIWLRERTFFQAAAIRA
ncbi:MFS transporter [Variovorax ginsengisoli]|uniref:MFS transporter n=1 Tax=Variovorax ginsengisoli TaxID=363844 RepID=A0ABT8S8V1_9BURK|nr:MFS transporter [Variovorax ginsengisoli]MDN8614686.1 MFS transporter [Variovorax ginsengisoli]MDO1533856.1 MFS transporter [Variovorax ginsengisoli]